MNILDNNMNLICNVDRRISLNDFLTNELLISARLKNKLIKNQNILLNGKFIDTRLYANIGDIITIVLNYSEDNSNIIPTKMNLDIIYEDNFLLAVNKPAGIPVHPSMLHFTDSLSNGVKYYFDSINLSKKIRAINRIDLNTSGLVLFAKNEYIQECLIKQMNLNEFKKTYLAIVSGHMQKDNGIINLPISRKENSIIERCVTPLGQNAITYYEVLQSYPNYSLLQCTLKTGRTHQIRVHMAYIGNPILGDTLYNSNPSSSINRQALHSYKMEFTHPIFNKNILLEAPVPLDMKKLI